eukprot:GHVR01091623.1.p1 GENE.GHVR01091623.1~~GHVR01091623.1.p1  ORF type:complete len:120 (+),score=13.54 GHVR01091623.1:106-465(+)
MVSSKIAFFRHNVLAAFLELNLEKKDIEYFQLTELHEFVTQKIVQEHEHNGYEECKQLGTLLQNIKRNSEKSKNSEDKKKEKNSESLNPIATQSSNVSPLHLKMNYIEITLEYQVTKKN